MKFKATDEQAKQIFINAINASSSVGMGFLHYEDKIYTAEDIKSPANADLGLFSADYFHGRMTKLTLTEKSPGTWKITRPKYPPNPEYQSWAETYPTLEVLITSVSGVELIEEEL